MSIPIAKRIQMPSGMNGIPCSICLKTERLRQCINKAQSYLDRQFTKEEKFQFYRTCSKQAATEAKASWDVLSDKSAKKFPLRNLIRRKLRHLWLKEQDRRQNRWPRALRLDGLRSQMSALSHKHPKCAACKICFGGEHLDSPNPSPIGDLCSSCFNSYKKQGHDTFIKRVPRSEDFEL